MRVFSVGRRFEYLTADKTAHWLDKSRDAGISDQSIIEAPVRAS